MSQVDSEVSAVVPAATVDPSRVVAAAQTSTAAVPACKKRKATAATVVQSKYQDLTNAYLQAKEAIASSLTDDLKGLFVTCPALGRITISLSPRWSFSFESLHDLSDGWIKPDLSPYEEISLDAWANDPYLQQAFGMAWYEGSHFELEMDQDGDLEFTIDDVTQ
jgi:hypothetical protein